ncbi:MAG: lytic murein transglycosylase, partial [Solirubrobacteraceae bacterium]
MRRLLLPALVLAGIIAAAAPPDSGAWTIVATESGQVVSTSTPGEGSTPAGNEAGASTSSSTPTAPSSQPPISTTSPPRVVSQNRQPTSPAAGYRPPTARAKTTPSLAGESGGTASQTGSSSLPARAPALAPNPSAFEPFTPSPALMLPGTSPLLDFFIDTYRTPPFLLPIYLAAAERYAVPWQVLAAINEVESDYGYDLDVSSAGAEGWMQFLPEEWSAYGVDANGAGLRDPYNPADAIFAAARYLQAAGAAHNLRGAIYGYNHSSGYVESVLLRARLLGKTPLSIIGGLAAIVDGRMPVQSASVYAATSAWTTTPRRAVVGANIEVAPGTPVVAVQNAEVIHIGRNAKLGRFIELRDAYGDVYT